MLERVDNKPMWLLTRLENCKRCWVYDGFWGKELKRMLKQGWEVYEYEEKK